MISETAIHKVGGSLMVVIPDAYVKHFKLDKKRDNGKCKIEDMGDNEAKLIFQKW